MMDMLVGFGVLVFCWVGWSRGISGVGVETKLYPISYVSGLHQSHTQPLLHFGFVYVILNIKGLALAC